MRYCRESMIYAFVGSAAAIGIVACANAAPPDVMSFYPTGVQRGQTAEIVVSGNIGNWPLKVWTEMPGLTIEPAAEKGKLKVTAAADAPVGIHWIRLVSDDSASPPRPLLVGTLSEMVETERSEERR